MIIFKCSLCGEDSKSLYQYTTKCFTLDTTFSRSGREYTDFELCQKCLNALLHWKKDYAAMLYQEQREHRDAAEMQCP